MIRSIIQIFLAVAVIATAANAELAIDPQFEGVYEVRVSCDDRLDPTECPTLEGFHKLVITNTMSARGVTVSINHGELMQAIYGFSISYYSEGGAMLEGSDAYGARKGDIHLEIDADAKKISGWITDAALVGPVRLDGDLIASPGAYYATTVPTSSYSLSELEGVYEGYMSNNLRGKLIIRRRTIGPSDAFTAAFVVTEPTTSRTNFSVTEYLPEKAVLNMANNHKDGSTLKWTVGIKQDEKGFPRFSGLSYSSGTGKESKISFAKVAGLPPIEHAGN